MDHEGGKLSCKWVLEGELSKTTYKVSARGKGYWLALVRVEKGEICLYVHDIELQRIVESSELGMRITASGQIEPHSRYSQAEKPYFLSPSSISLEK
jgi:hypothetical protein